MIKKFTTVQRWRFIIRIKVLMKFNFEIQLRNIMKLIKENCWTFNYLFPAFYSCSSNNINDCRYGLGFPHLWFWLWTRNHHKKSVGTSDLTSHPYIISQFLMTQIKTFANLGLETIQNFDQKFVFFVAKNIFCLKNSVPYLWLKSCSLQSFDDASWWSNWVFKTNT